MARVKTMNAALSVVLKQLGDPSHSVRENTLTTLLSCQDFQNLSDADWNLLFEAIFRTLWLADQPQHEATTDTVSNILQRLTFCSGPCSALTQFWFVFNKNWSSIDRYRLNKFYMLLDKVIYKLLNTYDDHPESLESTLAFFFNGDSSTTYLVGLRLHISELLFSALKSTSPENPLYLKLLSAMFDIMLIFSKLSLSNEIASYIHMIANDSKTSFIVLEVVPKMKASLSDGRVNATYRKSVSSILNSIV